ncbi:ABC transporter permease/substrate-binding protein [Megasphaera sp.]|uniref:ABC transporter permease/substrate-binding protein n=3 Tax=Megasphaera sp. TaxID=2023260 RepID=UPI0025FFF27A|nr:ABC transporter permease/substrate-binding protein [uncultured Megasphaera sp.]
MENLMSTFSERQGELVQLLLEHVQISMIALFVAILLAVPFAIFVVKYKKASELTLQLAGILQTIPSLALLGLFIPFLGIGKVPAIVALVIYGLFPILQNTITGLQGIDPLLQEAAEAFGMSRMEKLKKFELVLAMPSIIGGIRTSSVMLIGTATLGALIGAGGLGTFILLGIDRNNSALILIGAITAALLAVVVSALIKFLEKRSLKVIGLSFVTALALLVLSTVNIGGLSGNTLIAAGKLGSEPEILINMYKDLIEDETNIKVTVKPSFGKTSFLYEALKNGSIDMYPEFTGTVTSSLIKPPMTGLSNNPETVYEAAKAGILKQDDLVFLEPMAYQNTYAIAVKRSYAEQYGLKTISDLKKVENTARAGFSLEFNDREDGNKGLKSLYGLNLPVVTMEPSLRYEAIDKDNVDVIDVFSTDPEIITHDLVMLEDDKGLFPPYQGAPLLRADTIKKYPQLVPVLNKLAHMITTEEMLKMNYEVDIEGKPAADVARAYLVSKGLLKE